MTFRGSVDVQWSIVYAQHTQLCVAELTSCVDDGGGGGGGGGGVI